MHHSNKKMNPLFICDVKSVIVISDARHYVERVVFHARNCDVICDVYRDVLCDVIHFTKYPASVPVYLQLLYLQQGQRCNVSKCV